MILIGNVELGETGFFDIFKSSSCMYPADFVLYR
jgi:hypothetical protein